MHAASCLPRRLDGVNQSQSALDTPDDASCWNHFKLQRGRTNRGRERRMEKSTMEWQVPVCASVWHSNVTFACARKYATARGQRWSTLWVPSLRTMEKLKIQQTGRAQPDFNRSRSRLGVQTAVRSSGQLPGAIQMRARRGAEGGGASLSCFSVLLRF